MQVLWHSALQGHPSQPCDAGAGEGCGLSSMAWMPDASSVAVMDNTGTLVLLDIHGVIHRLQPLTHLNQHQPQVGCKGKAVHLCWRGESGLALLLVHNM